MKEKFKRTKSINDIKKKYFRKRVVLHSEDRYNVQYAHYNFIPIWKPLTFWFEQTLLSNTECWTVALFKYDEAVKIAKSLNSITDVLKYYTSYKKQEALFYSRRLEYLERNAKVVVEEIV